MHLSQQDRQAVVQHLSLDEMASIVVAIMGPKVVVRLCLGMGDAGVVVEAEVVLYLSLDQDVVQHLSLPARTSLPVLWV